MSDFFTPIEFLNIEGRRAPNRAQSGHHNNLKAETQESISSLAAVAT
jgi:hypothetical protein